MTQNGHISPQHTQYNCKCYRCTSSAKRWWSYQPCNHFHHTSSPRPWYVHFASCLPTVIYNVFMHNNAFWSNSNAFSLIICKVYTKGGGIWQLEIWTWKSYVRPPILHNSKQAETSQRFFIKYMKNIGANKYQRGPTRWVAHLGTPGPPGAPWWVVLSPAHLRRPSSGI